MAISDDIIFHFNYSKIQNCICQAYAQNFLGGRSQYEIKKTEESGKI